jgi:hypothetical protein
MRVYDGLFSPVLGVARGYQCPVLRDGKRASRVKDKFVKEWGPASYNKEEEDLGKEVTSLPPFAIVSSI